jgi:excisionase family DNA binding protein
MTTKSQRFEVISRNSNERRLLTIQEAAQFLAISVSTLYGWVWQKRIPFVKMGRALRFDFAEIEQFIDSNRIQPRNFPTIRPGRSENCYNTRAAGKG